MQPPRTVTIYTERKPMVLKGIIHLVSINMSFSDIGLAKLGAEKFNDDVFNGGQFKDMNTPSAGETAEDH
ncbi:unnamed protein product [Penicillium nalgiovense]|nr:unnamed protein product [Penicillium nalgiovense]